MLGQIKNLFNKTQQHTFYQIKAYLEFSKDCDNLNEALMWCAKFKGVESVEFDKEKSQVVIVRGCFDVEKLCNYISKEASKEVELIRVSIQKIMAVLKFSRHCDNCVNDVLRCCRNLKGVESAEATSVSTLDDEDKSLLIVKGRVDINKLCGYLWEKASKKVEKVSIQEEWVQDETITNGDQSNDTSDKKLHSYKIGIRVPLINLQKFVKSIFK